MNKLKFLYDVVSTMRSKEIIQGVVTAEVEKDQVKVAAFENDFTKNMATGRTQAKIRAEVDCEGRKYSHEGRTEFELPGHFGLGCRHHDGRHGWHHHGWKHGGLKNRLGRLALLLSLLNQLEVKEQEDKGAIASLSLADLPVEIKEELRAKIQHHAMHHGHGGHGGQGWWSALGEQAEVQGMVRMIVNKNGEITSITAEISGGDGDEPALRAKAAVELRW